ncbi:alkaline phosphatase [Halopseudomonas oceani]|uniref:BREX-1 system phosphatase PglZ type A n=1 Tax=Halopseudomonas oceani TaxID=1708783 RepID=A0A2P4ESM7_9GAMM|nr:BREX-1 system phosphatase PglZ type A [Halopseudomonas oceani]POB02047.1 BREX-1 system phosphatase PglZ type A [Halopseudomonas oceani]GGE43259.1 alkaline phosphatase [Halopseudomonas oceani]
MSSSRVSQALANLFEKQRLVFWYDHRLEFREEFESLNLPGVEKIELVNNEFGVKYRILREQPEQKFLLYREGGEPAYLDNWLLDVQLASGSTFRTDQVALWLAELALGPDCYPVLEEHSAFFAAAKRREQLQKLLEPDDSHNKLRFKMLAVCAGCEPRLDVIVEELLAELANSESGCIKLIDASGLGATLWEHMKRAYGYVSEQPGMHDFVIELFKACFMMGTDPGYQARLSAEAQVLLRRWKDSRSHESSFERLSHECAKVLRIDDHLHKLGYRALLELDYFELIDRKILSELVRDIVTGAISSAEVAQIVRQRRQSHWFSNFEDVYLALGHASQFLQTLDMAKLEMSSLADGVDKYAKTWFRLDQLYRKFTFHSRQSGQASLLEELNNQVENQYTNNYLTRLNDRWQQFVDSASTWSAAPVMLQRNFFSRYVKPFMERKTKVCVLISDAFRYEVAEELQSLIRQEDRFEAGLEPALSMLPSYTQLGMAALLPNQVLQLAENDSGDALVDGLSAQGSANRAKILASAVPSSTVILAKDLMTMNQNESRALLRENDVVYVYHNLIDKTGDTRDTEERVFAAAEETLAELVRLIKKLTNANASNLLVTADHGFIYQHRPLSESDFLSSAPDGDEVLYRDRRFVLGHGLREQPGFRSFTPEQLGLGGTLGVQIPKSINRLRLKGSGSRFVHGGATLQEVVIPVVRINKKRQSDVGKVDVEFIGGGGRTITTGQVAVVLYQTEPVTEKTQARRLRLGLYTLDNDLISDSHDLTFDFVSESPREREQSIRLLLSRKADDVNNQQVELRLEEQVEGTSHFTQYKATRYTIRRSFSSEFDF